MTPPKLRGDASTLTKDFHPQLFSLSPSPMSTIAYPSNTITFEVFYGVSSPWAFLGAPRLHSIASRYGLTLHLRPILVIQENGGIPLAQRTPARRTLALVALLPNLQLT